MSVFKIWKKVLIVLDTIGFDNSNFSECAPKWESYKCEVRINILCKNTDMYDYTCVVILNAVSEKKASENAIKEIVEKANFAETDFIKIHVKNNKAAYFPASEIQHIIASVVRCEEVRD